MHIYIYICILRLTGESGNEVPRIIRKILKKIEIIDNMHLILKNK